MMVGIIGENAIFINNFMKVLLPKQKSRLLYMQSVQGSDQN
jgi:hypothetical protein